MDLCRKKKTEIEYPQSTEYSGKYLIFCANDEINDIWIKIKKSTEDGLLGDMSKVSTKLAIKMKKHQGKSCNMHVICIYSYSKYDLIDRARIENHLKNITSKILQYKTNKDTLKKLSQSELERLQNIIVF